MVLLVATGIAALLVGVTFVLIVLGAWGSSPTLRVDILARQLEKAEGRNNRTLAIKLMMGVAPRDNPAAQLLTLMFSLELPRQTILEGALDYRDAPVVKPFVEALGETLDAEVATLSAALRRRWLVPIVTGLVAALVAGGAWLVAWLGLSPIEPTVEPTWLQNVVGVVALTALISVAGAGHLWRKLHTGLDVARGKLQPLLCPVEDMTPEQREGARLASELRDDSTGTTKGKSVRKAGPLGFAILAAVILIAVVVSQRIGDDQDDEPPRRVALARVTRITGAAFVREGSLCEVLIGPSSGDLNCHVQIVCPEGGLYGDEQRLGYMHCEYENGTPVSAEDSAYDDGDPSMRFSMTDRSIVVQDASWTVWLTIEQDPLVPRLDDASVPP